MATQSGALASTRDSIPLHGSDPIRDRVTITDLRVDAFIGVYAHEERQRQRLRFDVEIETVDGYGRIVRETGEYVCYAAVVEFILERAAGGDHVGLVETWAEDLAEFALRNPLATAVTVSVQKLDIFEAAGGVGVRIHRRAEDRA